MENFSKLDSKITTKKKQLKKKPQPENLFEKIFL